MHDASQCDAQRGGETGAQPALQRAGDGEQKVHTRCRDQHQRSDEKQAEVLRAEHGAYIISSASAVASPPPMHNDATPRLPPVLRSAPSSVTTIRAPEAPMGWPSAQAPPWMLTLSCGRRCSCIAAIVTAANASLISHKSTMLEVQPAFFSALSI